LNLENTSGHLQQFVTPALQARIALPNGRELLTTDVEALLPKGHQDIQS